MYPTLCTIRQDVHVGFCWIFFRGFMVKEGIINTTGVSIKLEWVNTKAQIFFLPDALGIHGFEDVSLPNFSFLLLIRSNWRIESCQSTAEQKASVDHFLWRELNQGSLKCYSKVCLSQIKLFYLLKFPCLL